jgi:nucleotide-binding universal stress UspA family protein
MLDLRVGEPHEQILASAHERAADLIVMGTHGLSGYEKFLFGSTTERVLRQTEVPVLAVPLAEVDPTTLTAAGARLHAGPVLSAIDFTDGSVDLTRFASEVAEMFGSPLVLLHVVPLVHAPSRLESALEAEDALRLDRAHRRLEALAAEAMSGGQAETVVASGRPAEQIAGLAVRLEASLVVLNLQGGGLFGSRPGAVAYRVLCLTQVPVLVIPPPAKVRTRPDRRAA